MKSFIYGINFSNKAFLVSRITFEFQLYKIMIAQSAGAVEYTNCFSAEG